MITALGVVYVQLVAAVILAKAARMKTGLDQIHLLNLAVKANSSDTYNPFLRCGVKTPTYKEYYFDIPVFADKLKFLAVKLVRDPNDPKLIIYEDAVWMNERGTDQFIAVSNDKGKTVEPVLYRLLDDMVYLKKEERNLEFVHQKCDILPTRPNRDVEQKRNSQRKRPIAMRSRGARSDKQMGNLLAKMVDRIEELERKQSTGQAGVVGGAANGSKRKRLGPGSKRRSTKNSRGSLRGGGSLKKEGSRGGSLKRIGFRKRKATTELEAVEVSFIEAFAHNQKPRFKVHADSQTGRLNARDPFANPNHWPNQNCVISMEVNQPLAIVKSDKRGPHGAALAGATMGYAGPLWLAAESGVMLLPALGAVGGAASGYALAKILMTKGSKFRLLGADKLFEKLYCMSTANTCGGRPCFKQCTDEKQNPVLMPYDREPEGFIRC